MSNKINSVQDRIIDEFSSFNDWFDKYEYVIRKGKELKGLDKELKSDENGIGGCQSDVWISSEQKESKIHFLADSDSLIVKGILSLVLEVVNDQEPKDIVDADFYFIDKIGLNNHLSPSRLNGLNAIVNRIKTDAKNYASGD
ncbi:MAG TPA: SufE family protein [Candidatus Thermoplasmatota archaeon]|nr:SufE family protein [Candidatus Thermoplasmatota archaeon]